MRIGLLAALLAVLALAGPAPAEAQRIRAPIGETADPAPALDDSDWLPTVGSPALGSAAAKVTIVVFSDFQCPYCARLAGTLARLERTFRGNLRIVFKHNPLPFHRQAFGAALATMAAHDQGRFWEMHDVLFNQRRTLKRPDLLRHAAKLGLDLDRFREALDQRRHEAAIRRDMALARKLGARGTPTSFVNGRRMVGAQPYGRFEKLVRRELSAADALLNRGVDPEQIYRTLTDRRRSEAKPGRRPVRRYAFAKRRPRPPTYFPMPVRATDPCHGPKQALVTIVGFGDFQCPFSARGARTIRALERAYPGRIRHCFKHFPLPFHRQALPAALAAIEAQAQGMFWALHDLLFRNTRALSRAHLEAYAGQLGMDVDRLRDAIDQGVHRAVISRDQRLGRRAGVRGTPSFFINGQRVGGARPLRTFKKIVDEEIKRAEALLAQGVSRAQLYQRLLQRAPAAP